MRYVSPIRRADLRERARTVQMVAAAFFLVFMAWGAAAFAIFMTTLAGRI